MIMICSTCAQIRSRSSPLLELLQVVSTGPLLIMGLSTQLVLDGASSYARPVR